MTARVICLAHGAAPRWSLHCAECRDDRALGGRFGLAMIGAAVAAGMMRSALESLLVNSRWEDGTCFGCGHTVCPPSCDTLSQRRLIRASLNEDQRCEPWLDRQIAAVARRASWAWASLPGIEVDNGGRGGEFVAGDNGYSYYWCEWIDSERCAERVAGTRSHP